MRYSASLDVLVTPLGFYRGSDGMLLKRFGDPPDGRLVLNVAQGAWRGPALTSPGLVAGSRLLTGTVDNVTVHDIPSGERVGEPLKWSRRGCTGLRASHRLLATRYNSYSAWIDLDTGQPTPFLGIRPSCGINNNMFPANGVLTMPNFTGGCSCNFTHMSMALVPAVLDRLDIRPTPSQAD